MRLFFGVALIAVSNLIAVQTIAGDKVIHAGNLIDGISDSPVHNVSIIIKGDKIVSVSPGFQTPEGAEVIDLRQSTVLPGLIEAHAHVAYRRGGMSVRLTGNDMSDALAGVGQVKKLLMSGFTSIRNLGSEGGTDLALKLAIKRGDIEGPRMWVSLEYLGPTGGPSDPQNGIDEGWHHDHWGSHIIDGKDEAIKQIRLHKRRGADVIKIFPSGAVGNSGDSSDPSQKLMTDEEIKAVVDTAHSLGMPVAAHAHSKSAIDASIRAGVDSIEHGTYGDTESFKLYKSHGTYLVPTLLVPELVAAQADDKPVLGGPSPQEKVRKIVSVHQAMFRAAVKSGVKIAFGTDVAGLVPYDGSAREFAIMVKDGMTPMEAIKSATYNGAELLRATHSVGSVQPGRFADLIAVDGDPLADIRELEDVDFVMKGGTVYKNKAGASSLSN
ncbi:metal-dependent hydrolase family protein [Asticcacaulis machinosus]|uniref:Amidohydrolase family protein n=1 Tax=Asticcacaulis machinosus TaxID=2984211 RepID=A0ABT5HNJ2_9CAUL|nr:amidohydrolase family protein [Asticcacaulis machinosus]MDC7677803.1 amidohydrolase family protein [Asticcacaulis machinosus]